MKRIYYAGGSALTSDALANAVLDYAEALAKGTRADVVRIPAVLDSGHAGEATLLVGPASQLLTVSEDAELLTIADDTELVADLRRRTRFLSTPRPMTQTTGQLEPEVLHVGEEYE